MISIFYILITQGFETKSAEEQNSRARKRRRRQQRRVDKEKKTSKKDSRKGLKNNSKKKQISSLRHLLPDLRGLRQPLLAHGQLQESLQPHRRVLDPGVLLEPLPGAYFPLFVIRKNLVVRS